MNNQNCLCSSEFQRFCIGFLPLHSISPECIFAQILSTCVFKSFPISFSYLRLLIFSLYLISEKTKLPEACTRRFDFNQNNFLQCPAHKLHATRPNWAKKVCTMKNGSFWGVVGTIVTCHIVLPNCHPLSRIVTQLLPSITHCHPL